MRSNDEFTLYLRRDYQARLFPWWGTMAQGYAKVGDPAGGGVWRARTRERLLQKMERSAGRLNRRSGNPGPPCIEVVDDHV